MPRVAVADIDINYREEGTGFPLILIHGLSDDCHLWDTLTPEFSKYFRTIALDVRGHGHSSKPEMPYSISLFAGDLFEFMNKLSITQANLMGLSMGAAIVEQFTLDHPRMVKSLILLSAFDYVPPSMHDNLLKLRNSIARGGLSAFFNEAIKLVLTRDFIECNFDAIEELKKQAVSMNSATAVCQAIGACMDFDLRNQIDQITAPTLIISGREDIFTPPHLAEEIHKSIIGSQLVVMGGVGHNLLIPACIKPIAQLVLEFIQK